MTDLDRRERMETFLADPWVPVSEERLAPFREHVASWSLPAYGVAQQSLEAAGVRTYGDAERVGEDALLALRGVGPKTVERIRTSLDWYSRWLAAAFDTVEDADAFVRELVVTGR